MSQYTEQAETFLKSHNLEFRAVLIGNDCPMFCDDAIADRDMDKVNHYPRQSHIHGKHYRCTVSGKDRGHFTLDFWNSYADEEQNYFVSPRPLMQWEIDRLPSNLAAIVRKYKGKKKVSPDAYSLFACITKNEPGTFHDFCSDYGYDEDSRKAETIYQAVQKEWSKVNRFFTAAEIEELQEIS